MPADNITLTINGREVTPPRGASVLEAARGAGIYVPTLCYHQELKPFGACRMCVVEIQGMRGLPTSCTTPATQGMVVQTETQAVQRQRRNVLELILTEHPHACLTCWRTEICNPFDICLRHAAVEERCSLCIKNKRCELQDVSFRLKFPELRLPYQYRDVTVHQNDPFYERDYNLCIVCGRCVNVCHQVVGADALAFTHRDGRSLVGAAFGGSMRESGCIFCGACVKLCPTGALTETAGRWAGRPQREVLTTCPYCGVGCQLRLEVTQERIIRALPADAPANRGQACVKGRFGLDFVHDPQRLTTPLIKRGDRFQEATWEEALSLVAERLAPYKGEQFALIASAKCTNEENYLLQKFARAVMGTNNIDHSARLCHASTVAGLAAAFGSAAMTNSIHELAGAACILAIGTNTTETHPVIGYLVRRTARDGEAKLIVANPRQIELCQVADLWLRHRPGSDVALLGGMARVILEENLQDADFIRERCENFEAFRDSILQGFDLEQVERETGVAAEKIAQAARMYATHKPAAILFAMGITQSSHGTDNVLALANLALLTGNVGKPSAGVNPLRGQNNVQGSCDMGSLPNVFPGYQPVSDEAVRQKFEAAWGVSIPPTPGLSLLRMMEAMHRGQVRALYLVGENPVITNPDVASVREALGRLDFFVAQDIFLSETAQLAHVVLPACTFAEKDGTFTNTERRVQLIRQAFPPKGQSQPDWWITCQIAQRLGARGFDFQHPSQIMDEMTPLTPIYGGLSQGRLEGGGLQWPCPTPDHPGTPTLHVGRFTRGQGRFMPLAYRPPQELPDESYPLILTTGRDYYQYHSGTMIRKSPGIDLIRGEERLQINPQDAHALGVEDGEWVRILSRRGQVEATAQVTESSPPGVVFMTFHFAESVTNLLTNTAADPVAGIPELKVCAVRVEKLGKAVARRT